MKEMKYHKEGDYLIPNIAPEPLADELRMWGEKYIQYKKRQRRSWVVRHRMNGTLLPIAIEVQKSAEEMERTETERLMKENGVNNQLRNQNPLEWTEKMNAIRIEVENRIMEEIICG